MKYYTVWVRNLGYRGREPLTYACSETLVPGAVVQVPVQRETVFGFVEATVPKPSFATKPISKIYDIPPLPTALLELAPWLRDFYATSLGATTNLLLPANLTAKAVTETLADAASDDVKNAKIPSSISLNTVQEDVVGKITKADTYLLHGRTGSGKTRIYSELARRQLASGRSAIILTPEISLTSQLAATFRETFSDQVVVLHSQLTPAERQRLWLRILTSKRPLVVIGPRSALFSPLKNIGLIVLDEAHEPAYKQEQAPYYHARAVASKLSQLHDATLVIGSATPSIGDYFLASERQKPILRLTESARANATDDPTKVTIIDLRDRGQFPTSRQLSQPLITAIKAALQRGEQTLLYLNRRGTARVVICENCGWQPLCPHCDLPLIYHADSNTFRCHTCGHHEKMATSCPSCGHPSILFQSYGTKAVESEVAKLFPGARVQRFDTDNTKYERFEQHYEAVSRGDVDILVGTQLLAKGLDLPRLSVLGILQADSSLAVPDFSAAERTYQLISQALGRVGRGHVAGKAFIQTFQPDSALLQAAIADDYSSFYNKELTERRQFHFPPYYYLLKLSCRRATYKSAEQAAQKLKDDILHNIRGVEIDGPTPAFHEKLQGKYQCQLVVRAKQRSTLLAAIKLLPANGWTYDIDPTNLL